jgi:predicted anti-sigma-YlaC factor YlaD
MNCKLCKKELESYREGRLPEGSRAQVKAHLEDCEDCAESYQMMMLADKVMAEEKSVQSNPFLATRVMAGIEAIEQRQTDRIPLYRKVIKPALVTISLTIAILIGVLVGNVYQSTSQQGNIPVELTYMDDAALESVNLLSNN